ncbi:hypothetical protein F2Q69_00015672 [Brassica cretica]|uniref:histidine--tRNA ligase n=1 Tax=Brassica cretica TaxID=69181 RepID=A0A8S9QZH4_BRACR|nr:hypothetical protein F2Q69_00015672 [Brassica cretica]
MDDTYIGFDAWLSDPSCESKSYEIMTEEGDESTTSGIWIIIGLPPYVTVLQELLRKYGVPENLFGRVCVIIDKIEKKPSDEIKKELGFTGISDDAIEQLLQVVVTDQMHSWARCSTRARPDACAGGQTLN